MNLEDIFKSQKEFFYSDTTIPTNFRLIHLSKLKKVLIKHQDELYEALYKDLGKSKEDSLTYELAPCIKEINFFIKNTTRLCKPKKIKTSLINFKGKGFIYKKPFGVCLIISSWNYPLLLSLLPLIGAIASGNTCILKLNPLSRNTNKVVGKILSLAFERYYVKAVDGGEEVLNSLLSLNFDHISVTGNSNFSEYIYPKISEKLIPITLKSGNDNPCIVHKDTDIEMCSKRIVHGKFLNAGQTYLAPNYIMVHKDIKKEFLNCLSKTVTELYSSDPLNFKHYSKIINQAHFNKLLDIITNLKDNVVYGGTFDEQMLKISPTIIDVDNVECEMIDREIFGPILIIKSYEIMDEVINSLKHSNPVLSLYLFSENKILINKCLEIPFSGGCVNDTSVHIAEQNLYFGGFRNIEIGNCRGKYSFDTFTYKKSILFKSSKSDIKLRYPNNKNYNINVLKQILKIK